MDRQEAKRKVIDIALKHNRAKRDGQKWVTLKALLQMQKEVADAGVTMLELGSAGPIDWIKMDGEIIFERKTTK